MRIVYTLELDDLLTWADYAFKHTPHFWLYHAFWLFAGTILVIAIIGVASVLLPAVYYIFLGVLAIIGWPLYYWWRAPIRYHNQVRREYLEGKHPGVFGTYQLTANRSGLTAQVVGKENHIAWSEIRRIVTTRDYTYVLTSEDSAYVIPWHRVAQGDYDQFIQVLRGWHATSRPWG